MTFNYNAHTNSLGAPDSNERLQVNHESEGE
jgi:hypothetical protein